MDDIVGDSEALHRVGRIAFRLAVDLGALSDDLIESELFGYEEGAFTGARKGGKAGFFELADGGTLFLDEIGNISAKIQTRLLRVLQEEDLYFRLKMGWLGIPSLRERPMDIPALVARFLSLEGSRGLVVHPEVLKALSDRDWPGNVRELRNTLSYMLAVREGKGIGMADLPAPSCFSGLETLAAELEPVRTQLHTGQTGLAGIRFGNPGAGKGVPWSGVGGPLSGGQAEGLGQSSATSSLSEAERFVILAVAELESTGCKAGRFPLSAMAQSVGMVPGSGSTRAAISQLVARGNLVSSRGRGGTRLTEAGRQLAELL